MADFTIRCISGFSGCHFNVVLTNIVYIFSAKQTFLHRVFSLDETNDEGKSGNGDRRIFE